MKKKSIGKLFAIVLFLMALLWLFSPTGIEIGFLTKYEKEVTENQKLWGGYEHKAKYEIIKPVFIEKKERYENTKIVLVPTRNGEKLGLMLYEAPSSIERYQKNRNEWPQVIGVINKGTTIIIRKFLKKGALFWGSNVNVIAEILDGEHSGLIVDISDLSLIIDPAREPFPLKPDPRLLKSEQKRK